MTLSELLKNDRLNQVAMDTCNQVFNYEENEIKELSKNNNYYNLKLFVDRIERVLVSKGLITPDDYEKYRQKINYTISTTISSILLLMLEIN
jgi:hypothetical protein